MCQRRIRMLSGCWCRFGPTVRRQIHHSMVLCGLLVATGCASSNTAETQRPLDRVHQDARCKEPVANFEPKNGVLSTSRSAEDVSRVYLQSEFPQERHLRSLTAGLSSGVWTVHNVGSKTSIGGAFSISMCQSNGRVLEIHLGK